MESFLDNLRSEVQCSLCNDTLTEPKILQCLHTFCKHCIKEYAELANDLHRLKCPECEYETNLPTLDSVEKLQPSVLHSRILNGLALAEGRMVCSVSESHSTASWYCFECDHSLCDECEKNHSFFTKNHNTVAPADLQKEDIEAIISRERPCERHPHLRLGLFCEDCDEMICVSCSTEDHKDHKTMSLERFASIKKAVLSKHLEVLEQLSLDDKEKQQQEYIAYTIKEQGENAKEGVKNTTKKLRYMLQENERELLRQIDEQMNTAIRNLNIIHHIPAFKEYIKSVIERGLASEMMNIEEANCTEKFVFNPIPLSSRIVFLPNQELDQQVIEGLGKIQSYSETDRMMSTILVEGEPEAAREHRLVLLTKTSAGLDSINTGDVVDIHISPEDDVEIGEEDVRTDGRIEVEFMAKVAGQLTAEVQVNGNHVSNSPLVMNVKPQKMKITGQFIMNGVDTASHNLTGIAVNRNNSRVAVADRTSHCVHVFKINGDLLLTYGSKGSGEGQLNCPIGLAFLNVTDLVIADSGNHRICIMNTTTGTLIRTFGNEGYWDGRDMCYPSGVRVDKVGNIIVCDKCNHRVQVLTRNGEFNGEFGLRTDRHENSLFYPYDLITSEGRRVYVSDGKLGHVIHVFVQNCNVPIRISRFGGYGTADGQFIGPYGLAIGKDNHLLVCDRFSNHIQKFTLDGHFVGKTCDEIKEPVCMAVLNDGQILVTTFGYGVWFVK